MKKQHLGSSLDDFLKEEGIFEATQTKAIKKVVARQLGQAMKKKRISKARMATLLKTSRTQSDGCLTQKPTSHCQAYSAQPRWWGGGSESNWFNVSIGDGRNPWLLRSFDQAQDAQDMLRAKRGSVMPALRLRSG